MDKKKYREILLETFKAFVVFCNENNLKYYMAYGSAIGVKRHQGLIPWDDDIDVYMLRSDYDRFVSLASKLENTSYYIAERTLHSEYYLHYAKFCNRNTTLWEIEIIPQVIGVFIDIFPLDKYFPLDLENKKMAMKYLKTCIFFKRAHYVFRPKIIWNLILGFHIGEIYRIMSGACYHRYFLKKYIRLMDMMENKMRHNNGNTWLCYGEIININKEILDSSYFSDEEFGNFEGIKVPILSHCHEYLTRFYGDFMTPPPIDKQNSTHGHYYVNLEKRIDINHLLDELK